MVAPSHSTISGERFVLNFHGVGDVPGFVGSDERPYWSSEADFVALLDAAGPTSASTDLPIQITFDDGNESDALVALPALLERNLTADFFVCAGRLGQPGYLSETQLRQIRDAGMRVGSHGWSHIDWRTTDNDALDREVRVARERLSEVLDQDVSDVAIPFGSYDRRVIQSLRRNKVRTVYTSDPGRAGDGWIVSRETWVEGWDSDRLHHVAATRPSARQRAYRPLARLAKRLR